MFKKCMAKCYAGPDKNLYLRGKIFYYMIELPRIDGKRRYYIKSLHTDNYYEAREKVKDMEKNVDKTQINKTFARLRLLLRQLTFEQNSRPIDLKAMCSSQFYPRNIHWFRCSCSIVFPSHTQTYFKPRK